MRNVLDAALRAVSYLYHLGLGVFLMVLALAVLVGPETTFTVGILPWQGARLAWTLLGAGAVALALVYLAARRSQPWPLLLWSLAVLVVLAQGYFLGRYFFGGEGPTLALLLTAGAGLAALGNWRDLRRKARSRAHVRERLEAA